MQNFSSPEEVAEQLSVSAKTVREWLRSGILIGFKVGKSWRIHEKDVKRLFDEQLFQARLAKAQQVHPGIEWVRGQCRECGDIMPEPSRKRHWVCSSECLFAYDEKAASIVGRGTEEFAGCCGTVIPSF
jgi:excisionase family DNA binding protein